MKIGDNVQVGGIGPIMTIVNIGEYDYIPEPQAKCVWFNKNKEQQTETYKLDALKLYVPEETRFSEDQNTWE